MPKPRYAIHPGLVESRNDGQVHYIDAPALAMLYGLRLGDYIVIDNNSPPWRVRQQTERADKEGMLHLYPQYYGDYRLPLSKE